MTRVAPTRSSIPLTIETSGADPMRQSIALCRAIISEHSKSFSLASRLLPRRSRDAAVVVYSWCRRADDAIDQAAIPADNAGESDSYLDIVLDRLRSELDSIYAGHHQTDPVLSAFQQVAFHRHIPLLYPQELLAGMEMDVRPTVYQSMDDLLLYCHRVAGIVGLMMCHVLGIAHDDALPHAAHLGLAMQLTNICRDVEEDWQRGRCYLPRDILSASSASLLSSAPSTELPTDIRRDLVQPVRRLLELAEGYYRSGDAGLRYLDAKSAWAIRTARLVYSSIGDRIARQGHDVGAGRAYVPTTRKLSLVARSLAESIISLPARAFRRSPPQIPTRLLEYPAAVLLNG